MTYTFDGLLKEIQKHFISKLPLPEIYSIRAYGRHWKDGYNMITIQIEANKDIEKYARHEKYQFIGIEYDYSMYIDRDLAPKQYDKIISQYSREFTCQAKVNKPLDGEVESEKGLSLGDKNWLAAYHTIEIYIPVPSREQYMPGEVTGVIKLLKKYIEVKW